MRTSTMARRPASFRSHLYLEFFYLFEFFVFILEFENFFREGYPQSDSPSFIFILKTAIVTLSIGSCTAVHGSPSPNSFSSVRNESEFSRPRFGEVNSCEEILLTTVQGGCARMPSNQIQEREVVAKYYFKFWWSGWAEVNFRTAMATSRSLRTSTSTTTRSSSTRRTCPMRTSTMARRPASFRNSSLQSKRYPCGYLLYYE